MEFNSGFKGLNRATGPHATALYPSF